LNRGRYNFGALLLTAALLTLAALPPASAQELSGSGNGPLQIEAEEGLEWRRDEQLYIARGNAKATRGQLTVHADELIARYRKTDGSEGGGVAAGTDSGATAGDTEIFRIDAVGNVRIVGENETAYGDRGTYDIDQAVVVLTGEDLRFEAREETITAEDSLEYWRAKNMAVARGDAVALQGERRIAADVLTAYFGEADENDQRGVDRIEAFDNVRISTKEEFARGDKGVYNAKTEIARLYGDVKLTRGDNQLNGGYAEVNLKTGVSKLMGAPPNAAERNRVKALLKPEGKGSEMPEEVGSGNGSQ
jgi:lipopolysaccharide export system protein LptA